jgi:hypothetical protein
LFRRLGDLVAAKPNIFGRSDKPTAEVWSIGIPLGDCWRHPSLIASDATSELMPLRKLSQWLAYSLIEPLHAAGISVVKIEDLTGLHEYRNGGLFIDTEVLAFHDPTDAMREA